MFSYQNGHIWEIELAPPPGASYRPVRMDVLELNSYREVVVFTGPALSSAPERFGCEDGAGRATIWSLRSNPARVWERFVERRLHSLRTAPSPAHIALAFAELRRPTTQRFTVITQNTDGLHARAGSEELIELNGSLCRSRCTVCEYVRNEIFEPSGLTCPRCPECGAPLRPDVLLAGEKVPGEVEWEVQMRLRRCDLFVAIGTSASAASTSRYVRTAALAGARTICVDEASAKTRDPAFTEAVLSDLRRTVPTLFGGGVTRRSSSPFTRRRRTGSTRRKGRGAITIQ